MRKHSSVVIVMLNWNGWKDTIACLDSLLPDLNRGARVVVCDNASTDGSLEYIEAWCAGTIDSVRAENPRLAQLQDGELQRPTCERLSRSQAENPNTHSSAQLVLICNGENLGFAAGNNVGLRFALNQCDMTHVWLLNSDTLVEPDCLDQMRCRLAQEPRAAVCGSVIHFFDNPDVIQCIGGNRFDPRRGRALQSEGRYLHESARPAIREIEKRLDYLSGCSMLLPRQFLSDVGLMNEDYFLYYEEIDWFTRAGKRYALLIADRARLYHREGASIGSPTWHRGPSLLSDQYMFRSRNHFMRCHYPRDLWRCNLSNWLDAGKRLIKGQWRNALVVVRVILQRPDRFGAAP